MFSHCSSKSLTLTCKFSPHFTISASLSIGYLTQSSLTSLNVGNFSSSLTSPTVTTSPGAFITIALLFGHCEVTWLTPKQQKHFMSQLQDARVSTLPLLLIEMSFFFLEFQFSPSYSIEIRQTLYKPSN